MLTASLFSGAGCLKAGPVLLKFSVLIDELFPQSVTNQYYTCEIQSKYSGRKDIKCKVF